MHTGFLILKTVVNQLCFIYLDRLCCFQSIKDNKFESNSQRIVPLPSPPYSCFQSIKDNKFESNSQHFVTLNTSRDSCFQSIKDNKFESNSQLFTDSSVPINSCFQSIKDNKFESNSQRDEVIYFRDVAVFSLSKIISLRAIHN